MSCPRRFRRACTAFAAVLAAVLALAGGCGDAAPEPRIGFTYSWGDPAFVAFLEAEIAKRAPAGAPRLGLATGPTGSWNELGGTALAAEVNRAAALAGDPAVAVVVGPGGSREVLQVAPVYHRARLAHIAPTATSRALAGLGEWTFLMAPNDSLQGEFIGAFADTALGARSAAIFYSPDEYGVGLTAGVDAALTARGVALIERMPVRQNVDCGTDAGSASYRALVAQLAAAGPPDVIVAASRSIETACLLVAARARWPAVRLIAGDGAYVDEAFLRRAGPAADAGYFVAFWHPSPLDTASMAFAEGFRRATGRMPRHGDAVFFDAVMVAAEAVRHASGDRDRAREYLASLGSRRPAYAGIAGPVAPAAASARQLLMTRVRDGALEIVGTR